MDIFGRVSEEIQIKYHLTCYECNEEFNIHLGNISSKENVTCPNCGQKLPDEVLKNLIKSTNHLENALTELFDYNYKQNGWGMSLTWNEINPKPEQMSQYDKADELKPNHYKPFEY